MVGQESIPEYIEDHSTPLNNQVKSINTCYPINNGVVCPLSDTSSKSHVKSINTCYTTNNSVVCPLSDTSSESQSKSINTCYPTNNGVICPLSDISPRQQNNDYYMTNNGVCCSLPDIRKATNAMNDLNDTFAARGLFYSLRAIYHGLDKNVKWHCASEYLIGKCDQNKK